jgi:hypothetical protein
VSQADHERGLCRALEFLLKVLACVLPDNQSEK